MRLLKLAATALIALLITAPGRAANVIEAELGPGQSTTYSTSQSDFGQFSIAFRCTVPAWSIGAITIAKQESRPSSHGIEVVNRVRSVHGEQWYETEDVIVQGESNGTLPAVVLIPFTNVERSHIVVIHGDDENPDVVYRLYCSSVHVGKQALFAVIEGLATYAFAGSDLGSDNVGRAFGLGLALLQRNNVLAVGIDVAREEMLIGLRELMPNNPALVTTIVAFYMNVTQEMYNDALYEMSPKQARIR